MRHTGHKLLRLAVGTSLLFLAAVCGHTSSASDIEGLILKTIQSGGEAEVERVLESTGYDVKRPIGRTPLTIFQFAMLCDHMGSFRAAMRRAKPVTAEDLATAASAGNPAYFLSVLRASTSQELEDYLIGDALLNPLPAATRAEMRAMLIATRDVDEDALDESRERNPRGTVDIETLDAWIARLGEIATPEAVSSRLLALGLRFALKRPTSASDHLLDQYLFKPSAPLGPHYSADQFGKAFEQGQWRIVNALLRRGAPISDFSTIRVPQITDPYRALGYFARAQLVDPKVEPKALDVYRKWDPAKLGVRFELSNGTGTRRPLSIVWPSEPSLLITGGFAALTVTTTTPGTLIPTPLPPAFCTFNFLVNYLTPHREMIEGAASFHIFIPRSDTVSWGEYHSVRIQNHKGLQPIQIFRGDDLIETIRVGDEAVINRGIGPFEVRIKFTPVVQEVDWELGLLHRKHGVQSANTIRGRLTAYQQLLLAAADAGRGDNTPQSYDARTDQRIISEMLREQEVPTMVKEALQIALQHLAEQAEFATQMTDFVVGETQELWPLISDLRPEPGGPLSAEVHTIHDVLARQEHRLRDLSASSLKNYETALLRVESLLYELAQYYSREGLERVLSTIELPRSLAAVQTKTNNPVSLQIRADDLGGKGKALRDFLKLPDK